MNEVHSKFGWYLSEFFFYIKDEDQCKAKSINNSFIHRRFLDVNQMCLLEEKKLLAMDYACKLPPAQIHFKLHTFVGSTQFFLCCWFTIDSYIGFYTILFSFSLDFSFVFHFKSEQILSTNSHVSSLNTLVLEMKHFSYLVEWFFLHKKNLLFC